MNDQPNKITTSVISDTEYEDLLKEIADEDSAIESLEEDYTMQHGEHPLEDTPETVDEPKSELNSDAVSYIIQGEAPDEEETQRIKASIERYNYMVKVVQPAAIKAQKERARIRKMKWIDIRRRILMADNLPINIYDEVSDEDLQELIRNLTLDIYNASERYREYINRRFTTYLNSLIPLALRRTRKKFPQSFIKHPGFMYTTSNGLQFWVKPDIPYYLPQFSEVKMLEKAGFLMFSIDRAITRFFVLRKEMAVKEVSYATKLRFCKTYNDIIKINPLWLLKLKPELEKFLK